MKIALAQYALGEDCDHNLRAALGFMDAAKEAGANMVMFPELCLSPFFPQYSGLDASRYAVTTAHEFVTAFIDKSRELNIVSSPNLYLRESTRHFDASFLIDDRGDILGISKMVHIAQLPCFYERDYYAASESGFKVYEAHGVKIGIVVCFDRHFPESIRSCVLQGAELILVPTANLTTDPGQMYEWEMRVSAMQNGVFIAMCNRVGREGGVTFCGESIVVNPFGDVVAKAGDGEELLLADLDFGEVEAAREARPYLSLRAPEFYL